MAGKSPNPYRDPEAWSAVKIGGRLIKAHLVEINGLKIEDEWKVQKSKEHSGAVAVFAGTKILEAIELTFEAPNEDSFDDLGDLYEMLAPKPGQGGSGSASPAKGAASTYAIGSPAAKGGTGTGTSPEAAGKVPFLTVPDGKADKTKASAKDDPGPRPPTLKIENAALLYLGVTAIARKSWEGPIWVPASCSWRVKLVVIQNKPPTPAGAGAMTPAKAGSQFVGGAAGNPAGAAEAAKKKLSEEAAGV